MPQPKLSKKQEIFETAARLFHEKGYLATSMRELAAEVGLEPQSLYSHIQKKEDILRKICFDNARKFTVGIDQIDKSYYAPLEKVRALIRLHIQIAIDDRTSTTVFSNEWRHLSEPKLSEFLMMRKGYEKRFLAIIKQGIAAGEIKPLNPNTILYTLLSSVRWIHYWYRPGHDPEPIELEREISHFLLNGLEKK